MTEGGAGLLKGRQNRGGLVNFQRPKILRSCAIIQALCLKVVRTMWFSECVNGQHMGG